MEIGLFEIEVQFRSLVLVVGQKLCQDLGLEAFGNGVVKLEFGIEGIQSSPSLGESQSWPKLLVQFKEKGKFSLLIQSRREKLHPQDLPVGRSAYLASIL